MPSTSIKSPLLSVGIEQVVISGSFVNAGVALLTGVRGKGFTAVRTSAGLITVTLLQNYNSMLSGRADVNPLVPPSKFRAQVSDLSGNNTFTITQFDGSSGAPAAVDAGATDRTAFQVVLSTSSVNK